MGRILHVGAIFGADGAQGGTGYQYLRNYNEGFIVTAKAIVVAHVPIMLVEGFVTAMAVGFLAKVRPEMLASGLGAGLVQEKS